MIWRAFYAALLLLSYPFVVLLTIWRAARNPAHRSGRRERFGWVHAAAPRDVIWIHAVSAGEVIAAAPLMRRLMTLVPDAPMLVTTMTPTGANQVRRLLGNRVTHCYAPYDYPWALRRFLKRVRPRLLVLIETELWPNMLRLSEARRIPVVLINARMSERSANRYRRVASLTRSMLNRLTWIAAQYPEHAQRYVELGARAEIVDVVGNVKFDVELPDDFKERVAALRNRWKMTNRPVWIAASTHDGEDQIVLDAHRRVLERNRDALLILVPRHPERFAAVTKLASVGLAVQRMTDGSGGATQVLIGDTMGQLIYLYGAALVAFIGGSLVDAGGHNPIEPATVGLPLLMGPYDFNFGSVAAMFERAGCLHRVTDSTLLGQSVIALFEDAQRREAEVELAKRVVAANAGATDRIAQRLAHELGESLDLAVVGNRV